MCLLRARNEERIQGGTEWGGESDGHPVIDILKVAPEGCLDNPVEFLVGKRKPVYCRIKARWRSCVRLCHG